MRFVPWKAPRWKPSGISPVGYDVIYSPYSHDVTDLFGMREVLNKSLLALLAPVTLPAHFFPNLSGSGKDSLETTRFSSDYFLSIRIPKPIVLIGAHGALFQPL